ncbi:MAG: NnrS family protein [Thiotrichales bacterium]|nr:MAG: NnrS family protein [Thiotrichales bacterium]
MINLEPEVVTGVPLFRLAFRPFFLGAGIFAVLSVSVWTAVYFHGMNTSFSGMDAVTWHAHEMIFGYAMAVIAGFLLTAIKNWTGQQTLRGPGLAVLFVLWLLARIIPLSGVAVPLVVLAIIDLLFMLMLVWAATMPVLKVKQYKQMGVVSKIVLLMLSNLLFYLGAGGVIEDGERMGLYSGLYMVIALLLVMARRVIPFFIEKGIDHKAEIKNRLWVDMASLVFLILLWLLDVFTTLTTAVSVAAGVLAGLHLIRMAGWYTNQIWRKPLLWVLYIAYASLVAGFALKCVEPWLEVSPFLAVHAFAYGGIGVMTLGMMSRVILGHTGRNVFEPPPVLFWCFALLIGGAVIRIFFPLISMDHYSYWIGLSQLLWIASFLLFLVVYAPMLVKTRVDGRDG